ncbi:hypothetical protein F4803DRAFT_200244 [Xylaria telfairii]|nr:hypothetical protein F4803DRAFT_200244 [Xylaria telfairii]
MRTWARLPAFGSRLQLLVSERLGANAPVYRGPGIQLESTTGDFPIQPNPESRVCSHAHTPSPSQGVIERLRSVTGLDASAVNHRYHITAARYYTTQPTSLVILK